MVKIEESWLQAIGEQFDFPYFKKLASFVRSEYLNKKVFPPPGSIFRAFDLCHFDKTKVVIIGQDPYHGKGQANGLCFGVNSDVSIPPSLQNIFKEIKSDMGYSPKEDGDLSRWAKQGILLLNSTLTVQDGMPGSHQGKGWEEFTDRVIEKISKERVNVVFLLWGNYAKKKGGIIDRNKHFVLESAHPSPFSAHNGFLGNRHFSQTNSYLKKHGLSEIDWR